MPFSSPPTLDRLGPLLVVAVAGTGWLALLGAGAGGPIGFPLDDAWIHMVYARSVVAGDGLAYNPGVPSAGDTAPLWALLLALPAAVAGQDVDRLVRGAQVLGLVAHAATALLALRLARPGGPLVGLVAGLAVAASPALLAASASGMEVSLASALLLGALAAAGAGRAGAWGTLVGLLLAVRPEAAVAAAVGVVPLWRTRATFPRSAPLRAAAGPAVVAAALAGWNLHAAGRPLPATFYAKAEPAGGALAERVVTVLVDFLPQAAPLWGWSLLALTLGALLPQGRAARLPLAAGALFVLANVAVMPPYDPKAFYHLRYLLPAVPPLAVAGVLGLAAVGARLVGDEARRRARAERIVALGAAAVAAAGITATWAPVVETFHISVRNIDEVQVRLGRWLGERLPPGAWLAANDAGAIRYFSERPVVDVMGLNTPEYVTGGAAWRDAHPVHVAVLIIPDWFVPVDPEGVRVIARARTEPYRVTGFPAMGQQIALGCLEAGELRLRGVRDLSLACTPWVPAP